MIWKGGFFLSIGVKLLNEFDFTFGLEANFIDKRLVGQSIPTIPPKQHFQFSLDIS